MAIFGLLTSAYVQKVVPSLVWQALLLLLALLASLPIINGYRQRRFMPPGPRGIPILGNILQLPEASWLKLTEWANEFGSIYSLNLAGTPVVVLNSREIAADLLDRRAEIYSSRPRIVLGGELMCHDQLLLFTPSGSYFRTMRRIAQDYLTPRMARDYRDIQESEACHLALNLLVCRPSDDWLAEIKRAVFSLSMRIFYGWSTSISDVSHPIVERVHRDTVQIATSGTPFASLVDMFPVLTYLPKCMSMWKRLGDYWYRKHSELFEDLLNETRDRTQRPPCFAAGILSRVDADEISFSDAAWLTGTVLCVFGFIVLDSGELNEPCSEGATDTTISTLRAAVLFLGLHPAIQHNAHAELDSIVGRGRPPSFQDAENLPYIHAIIKEVMRWAPVAPLSMPHANIQDDWYKGYYIPKGTIVIPNLWGMHRDQDSYPDPESFRPERYLDKSGQLAPAIPNTHNQGHVAFGHGKRSCVGMHVANQTLFIALAYILWACKIGNPESLDGSPILTPKDAFMDTGINNRTNPFKWQCIFEPRFPNVETLLDAERTRNI